MVKLVRKGKSYSISSSCRYHYAGMSYASAIKCKSQETACTNVPIHCPMCPPRPSGEPRTIWKYNAMQHILLEHSTSTEDGEISLPAVHPQLIVDMHITQKEESWLHIDDDDTKEWREQHGLPASEDVAVVKAELESAGAAASQKRGRAQSAVVVEPQSKARRTRK